MNWRDLKLGVKLSIAFGAITLILFIVGTWAIINISGIVNNAQVMVDGNDLRANLESKYVQHLQWAGKLSHFINDLESKELTIQTDHTKCDFGKWYYGEGRENDEALAPALKSIFTEFEEPHKELHASAILVQKCR